ncbi:GDYXXLXY domain-containing protein [Brevibacillus sp. SAFN-007a]|uniref:GDYXXLXY domain-containing protein n=1 Tax=Brevibacillus sp. SAFN-007a TaxID=3436862 RepID=UPI003F7FB91E
MEQRGVQTGYFLAISLLLSALFYFFASNWPVLDRWEKIGVSAAVLVLFYLFSYVASLVWKRHSFLSNWLLVAGGLAFGLSVALVGQIYNSHADSYMLFVVWLIPNLLFAIFTRYQPFYVISYVLAHLALGFFLDPTVVHVTHEQEWWYMVFWLIALGNILLFYLTSTRKLQSRPIYYLSFLVFSVSLFWSAFVDAYGALPELLYLFIGALLFVVFLKWRPHRGMLMVTASLLALFLFAKFFSFMLEHYSEGFFLLALLAAGGIVWGAVVGINWLRKESAHQKSKWVPFFQEAFTVFVTTIAALIGAISLTGLLALLFEEKVAAYCLFFLSLVGFLAPVLIVEKINTTVRYTLLTMGYMLGVGSSLYLEGFYWVLFLAALLYAWKSVKGVPARLLTQFAFLLVLYFKLITWDVPEATVLLIVFVFQLAMYYVKSLPAVLQNSSLIYALLALLALTERHFDSLAGNVLVNVGFFVFTTYLLYQTLRQKGKTAFGIVLAFWFAFLLMKYYDLLWSLLHKSFSLFLLSVVFFGASYWLERRIKAEWATPKPALFTQRALILVPVILLQFAMTGYQVYNSETILSKGTSVKLELAPVDPRSLLQGDYVRLRYTISTLENEGFPSGKKIRVVLKKQDDHLYNYGGYYELDGQWNKPYTAESSDVVVNGKTLGAEQIEYGIESYFVPEGTGLEFERNAKFATIKVGANGDALLESLSPQ